MELLEAARNYFAGGRRERVLSVTLPDAAPGERSASHRHGGFPHDPQTLQSCLYLFDQGLSP